MQTPTDLSTTLPALAGTPLIWLGAMAALHLARVADRCGPTAARCWRAGGGLALACGIWSAQAIGLHLAFATAAIGFVSAGLVGAWLLGLAACLLAFAPATRPRAHWTQRSGAAVVLALGVVGCQAALTGSLGLRPGPPWQAGLLAAAPVVALAGFALAGRAQGSMPHAPQTAVRMRLMLIAAIVAVGVTISQTLVCGAAQLADRTLLLSPTLMNDTQLLLSIGITIALIAGLLAAAVAAQRIRGHATAPRSGQQGQALRDPATGLPTRLSFEGTLSQALRRCDAAGSEAVLIVLLFDGLHQSTRGAARASDEKALKKLARRVRELAPAHGAARTGVDSFAVLVDGEDADARAKALAGSLLDAVAQPVQIEGRDIEIGASIGMAVYPRHGAMQALLEHAGIAAAAAQSAGGSTYATFDMRMVDDTREQAALLCELRRALAQQQLELYYQPKVHAPSGQITGVEALLRWHHPQRGMISPNIFIPMAEHSGLIHPLGEWVVDEACRQARLWRDQGLRMRVAVNLSARQLRKADLVERIAAALSTHQINPGLLTCEITETVAMEDTDTTLRLLTELAALGVHLSIDDFGSGYSSLAYLRKLPAAELKIDRSFVLDLESSEEARKIAQAVVNLAQSLKMKVVAEGVETEAQYRILRGFGCDQLQGFLFAKPMSAKALTLWAMNNEGPRSIQFAESLFRGTEAVAL